MRCLALALFAVAALGSGCMYDEIDGTNGWDEFTDYTDPANSDSAVTRPVWLSDAASDRLAKMLIWSPVK